MSYLSDAELTRRRRDEEHRRRITGTTGTGIGLMDPLNPISPIYVGNDYSNSSISDSCSGGYDSGSSSGSGGSD